MNEYFSKKGIVFALLAAVLWPTCCSRFRFQSSPSAAAMRMTELFRAFHKDTHTRRDRRFPAKQPEKALIFAERGVKASVMTAVEYPFSSKPAASKKHIFISSWLILVSSLSILCGVSLAGDAPRFDVQLDTISSGFDKKTCWVHPRAGSIPGSPPKVVLTMQKLLLTGSDVFFALNEMRTDDLGKTWSGPLEHGATLGRREEPDAVIVGTCDFWPKWHAKSGKLLGIGHTVRYKDNHVMPVRPRETAYSVYDPQKRTWTAWDTVAMPDTKKFFNAGAGCVQRLDLPNGDILLPIYFKAETEKCSKVTVLRCKFDGAKLTYVEHGNELVLDTARGLAEPSLTRFCGRYYLTLRHDKAGYVSTSDDGLHFTEPKRWTWDDDTELGNYNTQQHWVTHDDALFLVYTRRGATNEHIPRHRAPLFLGQVDSERLCVLRATERVLVPQRGARLGNFGVTEVNENETWVTVAEWMQTTPPNPYDFTKCMKYGSDNAVFAARIQWVTPNRSWNTR